MYHPVFKIAFKLNCFMSANKKILSKKQSQDTLASEVIEVYCFGRQCKLLTVTSLVVSVTGFFIFQFHVVQLKRVL